MSRDSRMPRLAAGNSRSGTNGCTRSETASGSTSRIGRFTDLSTRKNDALAPVHRRRHADSRNAMKRTWTIIGVRDVPASFKWYQALLGRPEMTPGHDYFGQILDTDGTVLLCLHQWGAHEHPSLMSPDGAQPGNGLLLFFRVDDFDQALERARALVTRFEDEPRANPNTRTQEFSLRDPD